MAQTGRQGDGNTPSTVVFPPEQGKESGFRVQQERVTTDPFAMMELLFC